MDNPETHGVSPGSPSRPGAERGRAKRTRRACVECHQAKLRCDAPSLPCTRCKRFGIPCRVDQNYRRVGKNEKIKDLQREIEKLRSGNGMLQDAGVGGEASDAAQVAPTVPSDIDTMMVSTAWPTLDQATLTPNQSSLMSDNRISPHGITPQTEGQPLEPQTIDVTAISSTTGRLPLPRSIDGIQLSGKQVAELFDAYFSHFHHHLDVVDQGLCPDQYYDESPLLFWTIISTSARRYQEDTTLLSSLSAPLTTLLWSIISVRTHSWRTVAAIVLQVTWPLPVSTPFAENSYVLSGVAMNAAIQLGLHQPEVTQDFSRFKATLSHEEIGRRTRIWVACNIAAQSTATALGYPSNSLFHWSLSRCSQPGNVYSPSTDLRHRLTIEKFTHRVEVVLAASEPKSLDIEGESNVCPLLKMLEQELEDLSIQLRIELSGNVSYPSLYLPRLIGYQAQNKIYLAAARLNLLLFYFFTPLGLCSRREGLVKAYLTAIDIITLVDTANKTSSMLLYVPADIYHLLILSCVTIIKLLSSSFAEFLDFDEGKRSFNRAISSLRQASVVNNDTPARSTEILTRLWGAVGAAHSNGPKGEPVLCIQSRGSASVLHDEIWRYREEFMGQANAYPSRRAAARGSDIPSGNVFQAALFDEFSWTWEFDVQGNIGGAT